MLVARSRKTLFYSGGKRHWRNGYRGVDARKSEELGVALDTNSLRLANIFTAQADAKPPGTMVRIAAYFAGYDGVLSCRIRDRGRSTGADSRDAPRCSIAGPVLVWLWDRAHRLISRCRARRKMLSNDARSMHRQVPRHGRDGAGLAPWPRNRRTAVAD